MTLLDDLVRSRADISSNMTFSMLMTRSSRNVVQHPMVVLSGMLSVKVKIAITDIDV
jgi:hypothetical protein